MKSNRKIKLIIILGIFFAYSSTLTNNPSQIVRDHDILTNYKLDNLKTSGISGKIHIDNNWTAAQSVGICTGNGTYSNPYVIKDFIIDGGGSGSCILIENTDMYFIIENCTVYNSDAGITLYETGMYLLIIGKIINNVINNCTSGIILSDNAIYNLIMGNAINNNGIGIEIGPYSNGNEIIQNTIMQNDVGGIGIGYSDRNNISGNMITNNPGGISFYQSDDNDISRNIISNNEVSGIGFTDSSGNSIFLNCFDNSVNAIDNTGNSFYKNYWADYIGSDADGDEIGDVPYNITGAAGSQDNYPLMKCPFSTPRDSGGIPIELIILISIISGGAVIGVATFLLIRRKRKRIE